MDKTLKAVTNASTGWGAPPLKGVEKSWGEAPQFLEGRFERREAVTFFKWGRQQEKKI